MPAFWLFPHHVVVDRNVRLVDKERQRGDTHSPPEDAKEGGRRRSIGSRKKEDGEGYRDRIRPSMSEEGGFYRCKSNLVKKKKARIGTDGNRLVHSFSFVSIPNPPGMSPCSSLLPRHKDWMAR